MNKDVLTDMDTAKRFFAFTLVMLLSVSMAGCFDQAVQPEYDGPPKVQFDPTSTTVADGFGTVPMNIQLIAPQQSSDTQFPVAVVDTGDIATTLPSDGYQLVTETATIPADSSFGEVRVDVNSAGIPPGETRLLTLALQESQDGDIIPATNFQFFQLTVVGRSANIGTSVGSLGFGEVESGSTAQDTFAVTNAQSGFEGNTSSEISNLAVAGDDAGAFNIVSPSGSSFTLPADGSQEVVVEFEPGLNLSDTTSYEAAVEFDFTDDADGSETSVELSGEGTP